MIVEYLWDARLAQYRNARTGRFVTRMEIRAALDMAIEAAQQRMLDASRQYRVGQIDLAAWRTAMASDIKNVHLYGAAAAKGGWGQLTADDYGRVGQILRVQYTYLNDFAGELARGAQSTDAQFLARVRLYAQGGRVTYHAVELQVALDSDFVQMRNVLRPAEHCSQCVEITGMGWMALDDPDFVPIGRRICLANDRCSVEFR